MLRIPEKCTSARAGAHATASLAHRSLFNKHTIDFRLTCCSSNSPARAQFSSHTHFQVWLRSSVSARVLIVECVSNKPHSVLQYRICSTHNAHSSMSNISRYAIFSTKWCGSSQAKNCWEMCPFSPSQMASEMG